MCVCFYRYLSLVTSPITQKSQSNQVKITRSMVKSHVIKRDFV